MTIPARGWSNACGFIVEAAGRLRCQCETLKGANCDFLVTIRGHLLYPEAGVFRSSFGSKYPEIPIRDVLGNDGFSRRRGARGGQEDGALGDGYGERAQLNIADFCQVSLCLGPAKPILITHTKNYKAVGIAYPLASRIAQHVASALGNENDPIEGSVAVALATPRKPRDWKGF